MSEEELTQSDTQLSDEVAQDLRYLIQYSRRINMWIMVVAFGAYGLAYYVYTLGQSIGAIVIATMGFALFRSLRKISFNLTWQAHMNKHQYSALLNCLDAGTLMLKEEQIFNIVTKRYREELGEDE